MAFFPSSLNSNDRGPGSFPLNVLPPAAPNPGTVLAPRHQNLPPIATASREVNIPQNPTPLVVHWYPDQRPYALINPNYPDLPTSRRGTLPNGTPANIIDIGFHDDPRITMPASDINAWMDQIADLPSGYRQNIAHHWFQYPYMQWFYSQPPSTRGNQDDGLKSSKKDSYDVRYPPRYRNLSHIALVCAMCAFLAYITVMAINEENYRKRDFSETKHHTLRIVQFGFGVIIAACALIRQGIILQRVADTPKKPLRYPHNYFIPSLKHPFWDFILVVLVMTCFFITFAQLNDEHKGCSKTHGT